MKKIIILISFIVLLLGGGATYYFFFMNNTEENPFTEPDMNVLSDSLADSLQPVSITTDTVIIVDEPEIEDTISSKAIIAVSYTHLTLQTILLV